MKIYVIGLFFSWISICFAQQKVQSKMYGTMLKTLLSHSIPEIDVEIASNSIGKALFLDARPLEEYQVGHIKNAIRVGYDDFDLSKVSHMSRKHPIVVYCSVGYRSEKVAEQLKVNGFVNVYNLYGGLFEWVNLDFPIYKNEKTTDSIHAYNRVWGNWIKNKTLIKVYQ